MTQTHRLKHTFTAGETSPLMSGRYEFDRYQSGCKRLYNMVCTVQGPATRRPGLKFVYDLDDLSVDKTYAYIRLIPFIRSETEAYALLFYKHTGGNIRMAPFTMEAKYDGANYVDLGTDWDIHNFDWAQTLDEMYFGQRALAPYVVTYGASTPFFTGASVTFDTSPTIKIWNGTNGWPERVTFHQQRLAFAATLLYRDTVWLSEPGSYLDFDSASTEAFSFSLASGTYNRIQWIMSGPGLFVGTVGDEWSVTGSSTIALTDESIASLRQTKQGSSQIKPILVGTATLFVERFGRRVNEFVYDYTNDKYKSADMSILAPHFTESYSIIDWTYQQTPDSIIWSIRDDGAFLGLTYQRDHKVVGWHGHATLGEVLAITSIPGDTREDDIWMVVKRTVNGSTKFYLEVMSDKFQSSEARFGRFLDSFKEYRVAFAHPATEEETAFDSEYPLAPTQEPYNESVPPEAELIPSQPSGYPSITEITANSDGDATFTGLSHLEGEEVHILIDGAVYPPQTVASGSITVERALLKDPEDDIEVRAVIGLPYTSEIRPNLAEVKTEQGTSVGRTQRITELNVDFYRTLGATLGTVDDENGEITLEEIPFRVPGDLTGQGSALFSGVKTLEFPEGFNRAADYFIRQTQPLPLTIRSVTDTIEVYE